MKILHILDGFHMAGIESQAYEIINNLPQKNVKNFLINSSPCIKNSYFKFEKLIKKGKLKFIKEIVYKFSIKKIVFIFNFCRRNKIDFLIIYPSNLKMLPFIFGANLAGVKEIYMHVGNTLISKNKVKAFKIKVFFSLLNNLGVYLVPASQSIMHSFSRFSIKLKKAKVIYNSCNISKIETISDKVRSNIKNKNFFNVVMVGRLDPIKDQKTLIEAFSRLKIPNLKLKIIGKGPEYSNLYKLTKQYSLNSNEIFCGESFNIPEILGEADIFAFSTTKAEGFGIVLIEAMAANLPIIASDIPACREVLFDGIGGILVEAGNISEWEKGLRELINKKSIRDNLIKKNKKLRKIYNSKTIASQWYKLLYSKFSEFN